MNFLFLRGKVDERTERHGVLEKHTDMWTHLFRGIIGQRDHGEMLYWGGKDFIDYDWNLSERWLPNFNKKIRYSRNDRDGFHDFNPEIIIARGGFKEYDHALKQFPKAFKVYYGAGTRFIPEKKYDLVLVDCQWQRERVLKQWPKTPCELIFKPAAPIFTPQPVEKKYDVCFVAAIPTDRRKRVMWVYQFKPRNLRMLHLGMKPPYDAPEHVKIKHVPRHKMPHYISQCKVAIVPYSYKDSGPRVVPEFMACGVPPFLMKEVKIWNEKYGLKGRAKSAIWNNICVYLRKNYSQGFDPWRYRNEHYEDIVSMDVACAHLKKVIMGSYYGRIGVRKV